ncbi:hypothetical protein BH10BDE1_BH10BDE1_35270 [soil metagenome]
MNANLNEPYHYNLGSKFEVMASGSPQNCALRYADRIHSFAELLTWSQQLTQTLIERGCRQGDVIAIGQNKTALSYALMLAALRLGVPYVNLDPHSPRARNSLILQTTRAKLLFFDEPVLREEMMALAGDNSCEAVFLSENLLAAVSETNLAEHLLLMRLVDSSTIAYIMFTSGSTGTPKGVAVTHQNVLHFISWGKSRFDVGSEDCFANLSPMYFDNSVFDFYVGLFSGASLAPISRQLLNTPYELVPHVDKMRCTIWFSVPSLLIYLMTMKALPKNTLTSLRHIVFGGEGYPKLELKKLYDTFSKRMSLVNVYGPTECTCICSAYTLKDTDFADLSGLPTLGHLNPNFDYRILDMNEKDASEGELCLIGPNVAAGYFNDPQRTEASFFTIGDSNRFMKRMYRTGDLVRQIETQLFFVGRKDNQIKHMGYRIELEEIEFALAAIPNIRQSAVLYIRNETAYGKLVAYVAGGADEKQIREALKKSVPEYMIPSRIVLMSDLPKNPNGKVDREYLRGLK